ncbi:MAG: hypothetical protein KGQ70_07995, partial [Alphaproteobacteria bacterium]|nr:hypothetical protein [Alphaproteobacteria bacterium]
EAHLQIAQSRGDERQRHARPVFLLPHFVKYLPVPKKFVQGIINSLFHKTKCFSSDFLKPVPKTPILSPFHL